MDPILLIGVANTRRNDLLNEAEHERMARQARAAHSDLHQRVHRASQLRFWLFTLISSRLNMPRPVREAVSASVHLAHV